MKNLLNHTDDELVVRYAQGNNEAFDVLLKRHESKIFSYIYYIVKDEDKANDVFQETFVKAFLSYEATGSIKSWLIIVRLFFIAFSPF